MKGITLSSDEGHLSIEDNIQTGKLAEEYFNMDDDSEQIPATIGNVKWINKNIPDCVNAIKFKGRMIGFTFIILCNKKIMHAFLNKEINEKDLFLKIKKEVNYENFDSIYLCSAFVKPEFRKRGLALQAFVKSIRKIIAKRKIRPVLFFWAYTKKGEKLAKKIAKVTKLELINR